MLGTMERLKRWLSDTKTTQQALGERLKVKQPTVCDWVNGENTPSVANLKKLSAVTGLSIDELLSPARGKSSQHRATA